MTAVEMLSPRQRNRRIRAMVRGIGDRLEALLKERGVRIDHVQVEQDIETVDVTHVGCIQHRAHTGYNELTIKVKFFKKPKARK